MQNDIIHGLLILNQNQTIATAPILQQYVCMVILHARQNHPFLDSFIKSFSFYFKSFMLI